MSSDVAGSRAVGRVINRVCYFVCVCVCLSVSVLVLRGKLLQLSAPNLV